MTPQQALDFLRNWTLEIMPAKHIATYNEAFVVLSKLIVDSDELKKSKEVKPSDG